MALTFNGKAFLLFLKELVPVLIIVGVVVDAWYLAELARKDPATTVRLAGTVLQLVGLVPVWVGLSNLRRKFGRPSSGEGRLNVWRLLKVSFVRLPTVTAVAAGSIRVRGTASAMMHSTLPSSAPLHERLRFAEQHIEQLRTQQGQIQAELQKQSRDLRGQIEAERRNREEAVGRTSQQLEEVAVGGFAVELMGLVWLAIGATATSIPGEIAIFFRLGT
ncbi:MAG: hypothetical protein ABI748_09205 [Dokdonella sp.]